MAARNQAKENICIPDSLAMVELLKSLGIRRSRMVVYNEESDENEPSFVLTPKEIEKLAFSGYKIKNKRRSEYDGILIGDLDPPVAAIAVDGEEKPSNLDVAKKNYIKACMHRVENLCYTQDKELEQLRVRQRQANQTLIETIRRIDIAEKLSETAKAMKADKAGRFEREFDALTKIPKVKNVFMNRHGKLEVWTEKLYCTDPRSSKEHEIGEFKIVIDCEGGDLTMMNKTRQVHGMHAPHIFEGGRLCEGSLEEILPQLYGKYEYSTIVQLAIQFAESVNVQDNAGAGISRWPVSKRGKEAKAEEKPIRVRAEKRKLAGARA